MTTQILEADVPLSEQMCSGQTPTRHPGFEVAVRRQNGRLAQASLSYAELHFVLGNDAASVAHVISLILDTAVAMKLLNGQEQTHVSIALQEALTNAIHHGNLELNSELRQIDERVYYALADSRRAIAPYADRTVRLKAILSARSLQFEIADEGQGFDAAKVSDPTAEINLDRIGGRGLLLINSFMDAVSYNARGNQITMVKYVSGT